MSLAMSFCMVTVLQEDLLIAEIDGECAQCPSKTRKCALESIPGREGTGVPPCLAVMQSASPIVRMLALNVY